MFSKRCFLAGSGAAAFAATPALAQTAGAQPTLQREGVPHRQARTVDLLRTRQGWPNGMALAPEGLWIGEQQTTGENAAGVSNDAFLYDWNGRVLRTFPTRSKNTSGLGFGGGYLWVGANAPPYGIFQMMPEGETVSHRQIPLGGGGCHGVEYYAGKLYIVSTRLRSVMRVDPARYHETAVDGASIWIVAGTGGGAANVGGLHRETIDFVAGSADPHGLLMHEGRLYSCDAGILPGAPLRASRSSGQVFRIDFV